MKRKSNPHKSLLIVSLVLLLILAACGNPGSGSSGSDKPSQTKLRVGATPVPHAEILEHVKPALAEKGIELEIVVFTDYVMPNEALAAGEIEANFFQHVPYLESFNSQKGTEIVSAGNVHIEPLGVYSKQFKSVAELPEKGVITVPNDPSNLARALILLENQGIIKLKEGVGTSATDLDIVENPKSLTIRPLEAAQLPRTLDEVAAAVINTNYALEAKLDPMKDAIAIEGSESPYANIIAVRKDSLDSAAIKALIEALQSDSVRKFIQEKYGSAIVPAF